MKELTAVPLGDLIHAICDFRVRVEDYPLSVSDFNHDFIEAVIAANMLKIQSLEIALQGATNEEWRGRINAMIIMEISRLRINL